MLQIPCSCTESLTLPQNACATKTLALIGPHRDAVTSMLLQLQKRLPKRLRYRIACATWTAIWTDLPTYIHMPVSACAVSRQPLGSQPLGREAWAGDTSIAQTRVMTIHHLRMHAPGPPESPGGSCHSMPDASGAKRRVSPLGCRVAAAGEGRLWRASKAKSGPHASCQLILG